MLARASALALGLVRDRVAAGAIAEAAMVGLEDEMKGEEQRESERLKQAALKRKRRESKRINQGRSKRKERGSDPLKPDTLKRMRLTSWQHLQRLVLIHSQFHLHQLVLDTAGTDHHRHFHVLYLDLLVDQALRHGSFEANVALNGFLYGCSASEVVRFQDFLTRQTSKLEGQVAKRRKVILDLLKEQLGPLVKTESGPSGQLRLLVDPAVEPEPIAEILAALAPWDGRCDLPAGIGDLPPSPTGPWLHAPDLYSTAPPSSPEEHPRYEVNRIYAVIAPAVRRLLARMLAIEDRLHMPKLFPVEAAPPRDLQP